MKRLVALTTIVLFSISTAPAAAQTFGLGGHAGVSIPTGDYGGTDAGDGFAELGFSGGLDLWYPLIMAPGLSWYTSADAIAHSVDDTAPGLTEGGYLFLPLMTGLRYDVPVGMVGVFVTGQLGAVFSKPPSVDFGAGEVAGELGAGFGLTFGAGLQINENIYGGLKYYPLGDVEFNWDGEAADQSTSFLDIYVGFGVH